MKLFQNLWSRFTRADAVPHPACHCLDLQYEADCESDDGEEAENEASDDPKKKPDWPELLLHHEPQDTGSRGWQRLLDLIEQAAKDGRQVFSPGRDMTPAEWMQITELPRSISKLKSVKHLLLYGSNLVRIPPEIGEMTDLEEFTPYTSYRLHWFPYEITRCRNLKESTVSTRALYGNFKYRPPFPKLPQLHAPVVPASCSVCNGPFGDDPPLQYWITLPIGTDVVPLLVHACSGRCVSSLPVPVENHVRTPHQGGLDLEQPKPMW